MASSERSPSSQTVAAHSRRTLGQGALLESWMFAFGHPTRAAFLEPERVAVARRWGGIHEHYAVTKLWPAAAILPLPALPVPVRKAEIGRAIVINGREICERPC